MTLAGALEAKISGDQVLIMMGEQHSCCWGCSVRLCLCWPLLDWRPPCALCGGGGEARAKKLGSQGLWPAQAVEVGCSPLLCFQGRREATHCAGQAAALPATRGGLLREVLPIWLQHCLLGAGSPVSGHWLLGVGQEGHSLQQPGADRSGRPPPRAAVRSDQKYPGGAGLCLLHSGPPGDHLPARVFLSIHLLFFLGLATGILALVLKTRFETSSVSS